LTVLNKPRSPRIGGPHTEEADRAAVRVGLITLAIGASLAVAPLKAARDLRFGEHGGALRAIGLLDMALVPGLLFGGRKSRWMAARAALNLLFAAYCAYLASKEPLKGPRIGVAAMIFATMTDAPALLQLRAHDRTSNPSTGHGSGWRRLS
jgi:hypothetical protein